MSSLFRRNSIDCHVQCFEKDNAFVKKWKKEFGCLGQEVAACLIHFKTLCAW